MSREQARITIERIRVANTTPTQRKPRVEVITPKSVVPQVLAGYTHDDRVQCAPGARPYGAGFAAAGAGIDMTTGRPWGQPAKAGT